jgi:hypothetical protein
MPLELHHKIEENKNPCAPELHDRFEVKGHLTEDHASNLFGYATCSEIRAKQIIHCTKFDQIKYIANFRPFLAEIRTLFLYTH